tara:strand:- start:524 stop:661 length:138 start_codon:yes stop_codon:yes gene_type:complete
MDYEMLSKVLTRDLKTAIQGLEAIVDESNDAIAVKIAEDTLEIIN